LSISGDFELPYQHRRNNAPIANLLSKLDDKIELNRKMNDTLSVMVQTIFKSWFSDTKDGLREGWDEQGIYEAANVISWGGTES
jgi:restriction endonuclease S subunit